MPIEMKFWNLKRTQVPVRLAKFDVNRCNESPLRGEKADFLAVCRLEAVLPLTTRNKNITSKAMQCRQDIVTRKPITRM